MNRPSRRNRLALLFALAVLAGWMGSVGCQVIDAARLLQDAVRPAHELAAGVEEGLERVAEVDVLTYRPRGRPGPLPGLVLCHGAVDVGARDSRLIALARALALRGFHVATPDLPALRDFRADPDDVARLEQVTQHLLDDDARVDGEHVSLVGISIGGSYCLIAAARPGLRERVAAVLAFGAYDDLEQLVRAWLVAPRSGVPELYDPLVEGRRLVLRGNLDALVPASEREAVRGLMDDLLAGTTGLEPRSLAFSPESTRLLECALSTEPIQPERADAVLAPLAQTLRALSPARDGRAPDAPVFLLHGEGDPIVPPSDAEALRSTLEPLGTPVRVHVTELFSHVTAGETPGFWRAWPLVWFIARFLTVAGA